MIKLRTAGDWHETQLDSVDDIVSPSLPSFSSISQEMHTCVQQDLPMKALPSGIRNCRWRHCLLVSVIAGTVEIRTLSRTSTRVHLASWPNYRICRWAWSRAENNNNKLTKRGAWCHLSLSSNDLLNSDLIRPLPNYLNTGLVWHEQALASELCLQAKSQNDLIRQPFQKQSQYLVQQRGTRLPQLVSDIPSAAAFKSHLKTHLLNYAYTWRSLHVGPNVFDVWSVRRHWLIINENKTDLAEFGKRFRKNKLANVVHTVSFNT